MSHNKDVICVISKYDMVYLIGISERENRGVVSATRIGQRSAYRPGSVKELPTDSALGLLATISIACTHSSSKFRSSLYCLT